MLRQLRIQNFKSLPDTGTLEIRPLTFLVGPNSSGKSSVLQVLLMLKQTVESRDEGNPLRTNGPYVQLGRYQDLITGHDVDRRLSFSLGSDEWYLFSSFLSDQETGLITLAEMRVERRWRRGHAERVAHLERTAVGRYEGSLTVAGANGHVCRYLDVKPIKFYEAHFSKPVVESPEADCASSDLEGAGIASEIWVEEYFSSLRYLGPLREAPQRYYLASGERHDDVGLRGERAIQVLCSGGADADRAGWLLARVNEWTEKMGLARRVRLQPLGEDNLYRLVLEHPVTGFEANVADVGFGVSQVLPVIIEGFYAPEGSTILLEHPEIHLHPGAAARLGDLLIALAAREKKTLIVETHSEHLLSRIQRRVAEGDISHEDVAIYYFDPRRGGTEVRRIGMTPLGQYENLPDGFFEEGYQEATAHLRAMGQRVREEQARERVAQAVDD
jgi:hypothetical protein